MKRAVILGGTGVLGRAIAWRLIRAGWAVDMTGRDRSRMPVTRPESASGAGAAGASAIRGGRVGSTAGAGVGFEAGACDE